jgi:hypothetical protein
MLELIMEDLTLAWGGRHVIESPTTTIRLNFE